MELRKGMPLPIVLRATLKLLAFDLTGMLTEMLTLILLLRNPNAASTIGWWCPCFL